MNFGNVRALKFVSGSKGGNKNMGYAAQQHSRFSISSIKSKWKRLRETQLNTGTNGTRVTSTLESAAAKTTQQWRYAFKYLG